MPDEPGLPQPTPASSPVWPVVALIALFAAVVLLNEPLVEDHVSESAPPSPGLVVVDVSAMLEPASTTLGLAETP